MKIKRIGGCLLILVLLLQSSVVATSPQPAAIAPIVKDGAQADSETVDHSDDGALETADTQTVTIPKAHPILITVEGQVGSKISEAKEFFPIKLAQDVVIDGHVLLSAGIEGEGQVVHAKKGGLGGRGGELVLAARYLMQGERKIDLRSFKFFAEGEAFPQVGKDNTNVVAASSFVAGPLAFLISGGNTLIEPGTLAKAKIRNEMIFRFPDAAANAPVESAQLNPSNGEGDR